MAMPYYVTPLMGALAWALIGSPSSGFVNQIWRALGGDGHLIDINTPWGIAWVMALFEGSVAFVMIGAVMKSMDPALEEASQVLGAGRLRTMLRITLPLVLPGVLGAAVYVFAEMLGSFSAALVLGLPSPVLRRHHRHVPARLAVPAALPDGGGHGRVAVRGDVRDGVDLPPHRERAAATSPSPARPSGRASWTWAACGGRSSRICVAYLAVAVVLPVLTLVYASFQRLAAAFPRADNFTLDNYRTALSLDAVRSALWNSLLLGVATASIGVVADGLPRRG